MSDHDKMFEFVAKCKDVEQLKSLMKNARSRGAPQLADAAFKKLISLAPKEKPGTVEHDFWRTVCAFELALTEERSKTTRLSRTRQKVARVGVQQTLQDWALDATETKGFKMLIDRGLPELTGEAIVLRHATQFSDAVVAAARIRLENAGVDTRTLPGS